LYQLAAEKSVYQFDQLEGQQGFADNFSVYVTISVKRSLIAVANTQLYNL